MAGCVGFEPTYPRLVVATGHQTSPPLNSEHKHYICPDLFIIVSIETVYLQISANDTTDASQKRDNHMTVESDKGYVYKDGLVVDADTAEQLGINADYEFEHWADPDEVAEAVFGLSHEQAKAVRESVPETE